MLSFFPSLKLQPWCRYNLPSLAVSLLVLTSDPTYFDVLGVEPGLCSSPKLWYSLLSHSHSVLQTPGTLLGPQTHSFSSLESCSFNLCVVVGLLLLKSHLNTTFSSRKPFLILPRLFDVTAICITHTTSPSALSWNPSLLGYPRDCNLPEVDVNSWGLYPRAGACSHPSGMRGVAYL